VARLRLAQAVESQFDTAVVAAFEAILASASEDYRMGRGTEFAFEATASNAEKVSEPFVSQRAVAPLSAFAG
jgi:hypothetical protein